MSNAAKILDVIYACAQELNKQLPEDGRVACSADAVLVGDDGVLDSLGLITLTVTIEQHINELGIQCGVMDELMNEHDGAHPFSTMGSMAQWIDAQAAAVKAAS